MLKSCPRCGRIHDVRYDCGMGVKYKRGHRDTAVHRFHRSRRWKDKSVQIRRRDCYLCQMCVRGLYDPVRRYETGDVSVHHIVSIADDWSRRLDDSNLITLCRRHHEMAEAGAISKAELWQVAAEQENNPPGVLLQNQGRPGDRTAHVFSRKTPEMKI